MDDGGVRPAAEDAKWDHVVTCSSWGCVNVRWGRGRGRGEVEVEIEIEKVEGRGTEQCEDSKRRAGLFSCYT